jgi:hypothetical protein
MPRREDASRVSFYDDCADTPPAAYLLCLACTTDHKDGRRAPSPLTSAGGTYPRRSKPQGRTGRATGMRATVPPGASNGGGTSGVHTVERRRSRRIHRGAQAGARPPIGQPSTQGTWWAAHGRSQDVAVQVCARSRLGFVLHLLSPGGSVSTERVEAMLPGRRRLDASKAHTNSNAEYISAFRLGRWKHVFVSRRRRALPPASEPAASPCRTCCAPCY